MNGPLGQELAAQEADLALQLAQVPVLPDGAVLEQACHLGIALLGGDLEDG